MLWKNLSEDYTGASPLPGSLAGVVGSVASWQGPNKALGRTAFPCFVWIRDSLFVFHESWKVWTSQNSAAGIGLWPNIGHIKVSQTMQSIEGILNLGYNLASYIAYNQNIDLTACELGGGDDTVSTVRRLPTRTLSSMFDSLALWVGTLLACKEHAMADDGSKDATASGPTPGALDLLPIK